MKQFPISKDKRYSIEEEFCGYADKRFVVMFCDEFIGQSKFYSSALMLAIGHNNIRTGAEVIIEQKIL